MVFPVWLNYSNQSTAGYSRDFSMIAWVGFFFLLFNQLAGYVWPYSDAGRINTADIVFALIAFLASSAQLTQTMIYPRETLHKEVKVFTTVIVLIFFVCWYLDCV